jgi:hypothetical protein
VSLVIAEELAELRIGYVGVDIECVEVVREVQERP